MRNGDCSLDCDKDMDVFIAMAVKKLIIKGLLCIDYLLSTTWANSINLESTLASHSFLDTLKNKLDQRL
jgi:hypothetical protein